jgi:DNA replication and repair protein RecF
MDLSAPGVSDKLGRYRHVLKQRNAVLKRQEFYGGRIEKTLKPWDEQLVETGSSVVHKRIEMVRRLNSDAGDRYPAISHEEKDLRLEYKNTFRVEEESIEGIREAMKSALQESRDKEMSLRTTVVGPHRDDIDISLGGMRARYNASQGEQRSIAFCLRIAQMRYTEEETGKKPVLLLDDILSELDESRRIEVLGIAREGSQTITSTTERPQEEEGSEGRVLMVEGGRISVA